MSIHPGKPFTNWAGNVRFSPSQVIRPRTIAELSEVIRASKKIRVVGSRHSFNEIAATDGTWIDLTSLQLPMTVNSKTEVEVPAAMTLGEVNSRLASHGLALASIGDIDHQQIGGLIATGTHGSGMAWGTMSDLVRTVKLVDGQGVVRELKNENEIAAARTHLGALGALVTVKLRTCPAHDLERRRRMMPIEAVLTPQFMREHDHTQLFYFPFTEGMFVRTLHRTNRPVSSFWTLSVGRWFESMTENIGVALLFALYGVKANPARTPALMKLIQSRLGESSDVAPSFRQMTSVRTLKYHELEMALDLDDMPAAFREVRLIIESLAKEGPPSERFYAHLPVTIRAVKGVKNNFLSPTLGKHTAYVSVTSRVGFRGYERYFRKVEDVLRTKFNARPHWGKHQWCENTALHYPDAEKFRKICREFDPQGKFTNEFVESRIFSVTQSLPL